jgi:hypothetical protein
MVAAKHCSFLLLTRLLQGNKEEKTVSSRCFSGSVTVIWRFLAFIFPLTTFDHFATYDHLVLTTFNHFRPHPTPKQLPVKGFFSSHMWKTAFA